MDNDKKNIENLVFLLTVLFSVFLIAHYLIYNGMLTFALADKIKYLDLTTIRLIRFIYCALVFIIPIMSKFHFFKKKFSATYQISSSFILFILTFLLIYGYTKFTFYNVYIYPIVFVSHIFATILTIASFQKGLIVEDEFFKGVSNLPPDVPGFYFNLNTKEGVLSIHKPAENIFIDGGPGSGKSHYLIKFFIKQAMEREYAGVIYDYEGDPFSKGSPILSNIAYSALIKAKLDNPENKLRFAFINFTDMSRTNRVNVLSTRYYSPSNAKLFINTLANTLMKNLEPSWKEKSDFWSANAINFVSSVMYLLYKNHSKEGYNTLPHAISICLSPIDDIFSWLSQDEEIDKTMAPMISAYKLQASQQTAGAVSSAQLPLTLLYNPYIYWVLSSDDLSLDVTNAKQPTILCLGNCPEITPATSPAISSIVSVVMAQMNNPGKQKSIFCIDELPRIIIANLDGFIATARKHNVSIILAIQDFMQLVRDYGDKSANTVRASCGTYFQGKTGNYKTAEDISKAIGDIKRKNESYSHQSSNSSMSYTESLTRERVLQAREISAQNSGHFFVQVSNGNPPFSFTDFEPFHINQPPFNPIPSFAYTIDTGNEETNRKLLESSVKANFKRIEKEALEILKSAKQ